MIFKKICRTYIQNVPNTDANGAYTVIIILRTKTEMEKAIDELKEGHEVNVAAIDDLATNTKEV